MRFELITLTVFVMIFMLEELVAGNCRKGQYSWQGNCFPCGCDWRYTTLKGECKGDGSCTCDNLHVPPTCSNCIPSYYTLDTGGCSPCGCSKYGATGVSCATKVGEGADLFCNCHPGYKGRQCDKCGDTYFSSNGGCCEKQSWCLSKSQKICLDCKANAARCDESKCECKELFTGKECKGAKVTVIKLSNKARQNSNGLYYKAVVIHCNGDCRMADIQSSFGDSNIWMVASLTKFGWQFMNTAFCSTITQRGKDSCATPKTLNKNKIYLLFQSFQYFVLDNVRIRVGNFVKYEEQVL